MKNLKEATYYELKEDRVHCLLCPHSCRLKEGQRGLCGARIAKNNKLYSENYGQVTSLAVDPIEKKPLYNFQPAKDILSFGTFGCSFKCDFCQNWTISQKDPDSLEMASFIPPEMAAELAKKHGVNSVAFTYSEPLIWYEFVLEASKACMDQGIKTVLVTNGYLNPRPFSQLLPFISAINVDIKSMDDDFYKNYCSAGLKPVLDNCVLTHKAGVHLEITNLLIPGLNDDDQQIIALVDWIVENLSPRVPLHFSAYRPCHKMKIPKTPPETVIRACQIADNKLDFIYSGNILSKEYGDTHCPSCGERVINRQAWHIDSFLKENGNCPKCDMYIAGGMG